MKEIIPTAAKLAVLGNEKNPGISSMLADIKGAASRLGLQTRYHGVTSGDLSRALTAILQDRPDVLYVTPDIFLYSQRQQIIDFTLTNHIPNLYGIKGYVREGGLLALIMSRAAEIVDKVLKGAKPADVPVEQPTKFELLINLRTAKALGPTIPDYMIRIVDEVIE